MGPAVRGRLRLGVQMIRSKSVYNKLDLETYNKYNRRCQRTQATVTKSLHEKLC